MGVEDRKEMEEGEGGRRRERLKNRRKTRKMDEEKESMKEGQIEMEGG